MTIADWLLARIAEDEADSGCEGYGEYASCRDLSDRMSAECGVKRRIVEEHVERAYVFMGKVLSRTCSTCATWDECDYEGPPTVDYPCPTLRALASVYADHPDYREEWRP